MREPSVFGSVRVGFMCQAPGQTANNEGLMDSLYPATAQMISTMLQLLGALLRNADANIMLSTSGYCRNLSKRYTYILLAINHS